MGRGMFVNPPPPPRTGGNPYSAARPAPVGYNNAPATGYTRPGQGIVGGAPMMPAPLQQAQQPQQSPQNSFGQYIQPGRTENGQFTVGGYYDPNGTFVRDPGFAGSPFGAIVAALTAKRRF